MPQICSTVEQETIDTINAHAVNNSRNFSNQVAFILKEWASRNQPVKAKKKASTKKK